MRMVDGNVRVNASKCKEVGFVVHVLVTWIRGSRDFLDGWMDGYAKGYQIERLKLEGEWEWGGAGAGGRWRWR